MGNSEVGHLNLGAGRIVYQDIVRIDKAIGDGTFFANPVIAQTIDAVKSTGGTLHLLGLTSPGNVHARARARLRRVRAVQAARADQDRLARLPRRPRHAAQVGRRVPAWRRGEAEADRRRPARLGRRALLRDGSRQALGPASRWRGRCSRAERASSSTISRPRSRRLTRGAGASGDEGAGKEITDEFVTPLPRQGPGSHVRRAARAHSRRRRLLLFQLSRRPRAPAHARALGRRRRLPRTSTARRGPSSRRSRR